MGRALARCWETVALIDIARKQKFVGNVVWLTEVLRRVKSERERVPSQRTVEYKDRVTEIDRRPWRITKLSPENVHSICVLRLVISIWFVICYIWTRYNAIVEAVVTISFRNQLVQIYELYYGISRGNSQPLFRYVVRNRLS